MIGLNVVKDEPNGIFLGTEFYDTQFRIRFIKIINLRKITKRRRMDGIFVYRKILNDEKILHKIVTEYNVFYRITSLLNDIEKKNDKYMVDRSREEKKN